MRLQFSSQPNFPKIFCLSLIISYITSIGKKKPVVFNEPCWLNLYFFVYLNGCRDASKLCITTKPSTLRYVWYLYLTQYLRCVWWYCVITTKEWLFTKLIFMLLFFGILDDILKVQHTTNTFNPILEHSAQWERFAKFIWYVWYAAKFWCFRTPCWHELINYE